MELKNGLVIVIHEKDNVIGVASSRTEALRMINEYYGEDAIMSEFDDIRDSGVDFSCKITVSGKWGGVYEVWGSDFIINEKL